MKNKTNGSITKNARPRGSMISRMVAASLFLGLTLTACSSVSPPQTAVSQGESNTASAVSVAAQAPGAVTLAVKKYKMATVKKHHTRADCWTVVSKGVYKIPSTFNHPGGSKKILAMCGKDATKSFRGQHGTGGKPNSLLKPWKIGVLVK